MFKVGRGHHAPDFPRALTSLNDKIGQGLACSEKIKAKAENFPDVSSPKSHSIETILKICAIILLFVNSLTAFVGVLLKTMMKWGRCLCLFSFCFLSFIPKVSANLEERFNITEPEFEFSAKDLTVSLEYGVSDYISSLGMVSYELYDDGCRYNDGDPSVPVNMKTTASISEMSDLSDKSVGLELTLNPDEIQSNNNIYDAENEQVRFCVRFMLLVGGSIEVNFLETVIILNLDLTDGFGVSDISTSQKEKIEKSANAAYEVEAYLCDKYNNKIIRDVKMFQENFDLCSAVFPDGTDPEEVFNQGHSIRVCVKPTDASLNDGVYMREIRSFFYQRVDDLSINQVAVQMGKEASNGLTNLHCSPILCSIDTILNAQFFKGPGKASASGIALLQYGEDTQTGSAGCIRRRIEASDYRANTYHHSTATQRRTEAIASDEESVPMDVFWKMTRPK